ncbi:thiol:disulfide interchange protein DsbA/DsbL [Marinicella meishanensis]|uniref:thiol:disulfide interchange protein DsbA/DsbL n=1 Tax=Marinicella meishanensis TaxID=2873263 RepID=UPI001CC0FA81|nr:thiol:disulfide interchange protein DsbA/DsbL [Marinicella sp. NBU2979]
MKSLTLFMAVLLFWGCSHADDQSEAKEAVAAEAKEMAAETVAAAKDQAEDVAAAAKEAVQDAAQGVAQTAASAVDFQPGIHYQVINPAWDTNTDEAVIVYEFFSYMCAHCASFEPYMKRLDKQLPENAKIVRVPVVFYEQWKPAAQAYYTFEAMNMVDQAHEGMFKAIHQHKKVFRTIDEIAVWAAQSYGVDKDQFLSTAKSFMVDGQIRKGMQMMQAMGVSSTPTLITNGKYAPNTRAFKTRDDIITVTNHLVAMELDQMGLSE